MVARFRSEGRQVRKWRYQRLSTFFTKSTHPGATDWKDRPSCCFAAPHEDENAYLKPSFMLCHNYSLNYFPPLMLIFYSNIGNRLPKTEVKYTISSTFKLFLVYERDCDTVWLRGASYATWQSHWAIFFKKRIKKMRSSRLLNTKPQDDTFGVRWDPHALKKRGLRMTDERHTPLIPPQWGNL